MGQPRFILGGSAQHCAAQFGVFPITVHYVQQGERRAQGEEGARGEEERAREEERRRAKERTRQRGRPGLAGARPLTQAAGVHECNMTRQGIGTPTRNWTSDRSWNLDGELELRQGM